MKPIKYLVLFLISSFLFPTIYACKKEYEPSKDDFKPPVIQDTIAKYNPVETNLPHTNYPSAFEGQTRIFGIKTYTPLKVEVINSSLEQPWGIAALPNGKFLITQKGGSIVVVNSMGAVEQTITNLPAVADEGQGGLLGICVDNNFSSNNKVYWTYSKPIGDSALTALAKGKLSGDESKIEDIEVLYKAQPAYDGTAHFGSRIIMDNQGNLLMSTGERYHISMRPYAQKTDNGLGKIIRIKTDGSPAEGNPFTHSSGADAAVYSYGHRNVQGLAYDEKNNIIYQSEMGPMGGDEINIIEAGKNYGWPTISYGLEYDGTKVGAGISQQLGMTQPIYYWDPSVSPSGIAFYNSKGIPEWEGNLLIACLSGQHLIRLRIKDGKIAGEERLLESENQRFRDVEVDENGVVYAITDSGRLYKIQKEE